MSAATQARIDAYRATLRSLDDWAPYLRDHSNLPGPRANLELLEVAADEGDRRRFEELIASDDEFLAACGAVGFGRLAAEGDDEAVAVLRAHSTDSRWRVREGVAMGLQRVGDADIHRLLGILREWSSGDALEQRAAVAAICEPRLLVGETMAEAAVGLLADITGALLSEPSRNAADLRVLRQALGYGWSVVIVAAPERGRLAFEELAALDDPDARWIVRENLGKARLRRLDAAWVDRLRGGA